MKLDMIRRKVPSSLVYAFGIPVSPKFLTSSSKAETLDSIGLSQGKKTILIMGGSLGIGDIAKIYKDILTIDLDFQIIIITGNNTKLKISLEEIAKDAPIKTCILGYTNDVNLSLIHISEPTRPY